MNLAISKKLIYILPGVLTILLISLFVVIFFFGGEYLSPQNEVICNSLKDSGGANNIVFFATKENAEKYSNYLMTIEPFSSYKNEFNFFYIDSLVPICSLYKQVALFCYTADLIKIASYCPSDYIIVLSEADSAIRSSAYTNVLSINTEHPLSVLAHEMGHAYANLAEEYVDENAKIPRGSLNCVSECKKFMDKSDGCFQGCTKQAMHRSIDNGLMRTLQAPRYGIFDESIIEKKIIREKEKNARPSAITGNIIKIERRCENEKYYFIEGLYNKEEGNLYIKQKGIRKGCVGSNGEGGFKYSILDEKGKIRAEGTFNPESIFTDSPGEEQINGETFESTETFVLRLPIVGAQILEVQTEAQKFQIELADANLQPFINENNPGDYKDSFIIGGEEVPSTPLGKILSGGGEGSKSDGYSGESIPPPDKGKEPKTEGGGSYVGGYTGLVATGLVTLAEKSKNSRPILSVSILIIILAMFLVYKRFLSNSKKSIKIKSSNEKSSE